MQSTWRMKGAVLVAMACAWQLPTIARADRTWNNLGTVAGDWNNSQLWTPAGVPGSTDNVTIPAKATLSPVSKSSGDSTIRSLMLGGDLTISGGSVQVTNSLSLSFGDLTLGDGTNAAALAADGKATSFIVSSGTFTHQGGDLLATGGASILVSTPTILRGRSGGTTNISAVNAGKLGLTGVTQVIGQSTAQTVIKADGGTIDISSVSQPIQGNVQFVAQGTSGLMNIPSGGSGWKLQVRNNGALNIDGTGNAAFSKSTIALEDANVFFGTDETRALAIAADSKLQITAAFPLSQVSTIYGGLKNHGQVDLGPYSELHLQYGFQQYADGKLTLHLYDDVPGNTSSAGPVLGIINGGPGTEISLAGHLTIDSTLSHLPLGYERTIMFATEPIVGRFDTVSGMAQANGLYFVPVYYPEVGAVTLVATLGGDANHDNLVDGVDYTVWADHFLTSRQTWTTGDFTGDSKVDGADYTLWSDHFAPHTGLSTAVVPEPATGVLAAIALLVLFSTRLIRR